jgi:hypothetical protein
MTIWGDEHIPSDLRDTRKLRDEYLEVYALIPNLGDEYATGGSRSPVFLEIRHRIGELRRSIYCRVRELYGDEMESCVDFRNRFNLTDEYIRGIVLSELPVYEYDGQGGFKEIPAVYLRESEPWFKEYPTAEMLNWWLKRDDITAFVLRHPNLREQRKLRKSQAEAKARENAVQRYARQRWKQIPFGGRPELAAMAKDAKKHFKGKFFKCDKTTGEKVEFNPELETYELYIRPLKLHNPAAGRRRKSLKKS